MRFDDQHPSAFGSGSAREIAEWIAAMGGGAAFEGSAAPRQAKTVRGWRQQLAPAIVPKGGASSATRRLGLLFEPRTERVYYSRSVRSFVGLRPLALSAAGNWVRSEVGWYDIDTGRESGFDPDAIDLLQRLSRLAEYSPYGVEEWIELDTIESDALWALLDEASDLGVELRHTPRTAPPVAVDVEPAHAALDVVAHRRGVRLSPLLTSAGAQLPLPHYRLIGGERATGLYTWSGDGPEPRGGDRLRLIRFERPIDAAFAAAVRAGDITVPSRDVAEFVESYLPRIALSARLTSSDGSVELPEPPRPVLVLHLRADADRTVGRWSWEYVSPAGRWGGLRWRHARREPVPRDRAAEERILDAVRDALGDEFGEGQHETFALGGLRAARFVAEGLPRVAEIPDVRVERAAEVPEYRTPESTPVVSLQTTDGDARDWFDLHVAVHLDGREVPFDQLFTALARGDEVLVLDDGTYLDLDDASLHRLRDLIEEARALSDRPSRLRITANQEQLWSDLAEIATVQAHADAWRDAVDRVRRFEHADPASVAAPEGLAADLRDYQHEGFVWLDRLAQAGLGGVLADDMGLGKTMQVLAMILADRARRPDGPPHLVVAPTSVVGNWAVEASRFAPGLRVVAVDSLARRRGGTSIAELARDADVVVTSYGLIRQEAEAYHDVRWATLVLDEAQAVKNPATRTYRAVRDLVAEATFCVTGTPLENSLLDLWALLGLAAPGLFPHLKNFTDFYRTPIEREGNTERLHLLHRRLQPLMLRRTKEQVADELPDRIEQVLQVELTPQHRRIYDTHLHRERQKVLGLLSDDVEGNRFEIFRSLTLLRRLALDPALIDPAHAGVEAAKLTALRDLVDTIVADGHRALVFSQFTGFLTRAREMLDTAGVPYEYLDGSTTRRANVVRRFREGDAPLFLISLKAGGTGLTLTEADYCILLDPWWNPAVERQAIDRAHRIGQTRNVIVYRLVAARTIEEKVMALKEEKSRLFDSVVGGTELASTALSAADIRSLLA